MISNCFCLQSGMTNQCTFLMRWENLDMIKPRISGSYVVSLFRSQAPQAQRATPSTQREDSTSWFLWRLLWQLSGSLLVAAILSTKHRDTMRYTGQQFTSTVRATVHLNSLQLWKQQGTVTMLCMLCMLCTSAPALAFDSSRFAWTNQAAKNHKVPLFSKTNPPGLTFLVNAS